MIKLTLKETEFLKVHKEDIANKNIDALMADIDSFGDKDKLISLLGQFSIRVSSDSKSSSSIPISDSGNKSKGGLIFKSIRLPSVDEINSLPKDIARYNGYFYFTREVNQDGNLYYIDMNGEAYIRTYNFGGRCGVRPIIEVPNLKEVYSHLGLGNIISLDIGDLGEIDGRHISGYQDWKCINDHEVIYNGELINDYFGSADSSYRYEGSHVEALCNQILDNMRELN